jgi:hypothetical protein
MADERKRPPGDGAWKKVGRALGILGTVLAVLLLMVVGAIGLVLGICTLMR